MKKFAILFLISILTTSCANQAIKPIPSTNPPIDTNPAVNLPIQIPENGQANTEKPIDTPKTVDYSLLKLSKWEDVDGLKEDDLSGAWGSWLKSCEVLINKKQWKEACLGAVALPLKPSNATIIDYLTNYFDVYVANNVDGTNTGLITGYYEPLLKGSRIKSAKYPNPLYQQPKDLITVDLADLYPELKYKRVRGKLVGNKLVPYRTRAEIESNPSPLVGSELVWIDDIIDVFFLQIQGSGLVQLENGEKVHVGYADQNGHPYCP
jgi:membrane-bound lytic murein transglycosylase A